MSEILTKGHELYAALASGNVAALTSLLTEDFQGQLTVGLPHGLGRLYDGRHAMMNDGWGGVGAYFDMSPHVDELFDGHSTLIGRGLYVGVVKLTGKPIRAAFAHFWGFDGSRFTSVKQVTDSGVWRDALQS